MLPTCANRGIAPYQSEALVGRYSAIWRPASEDVDTDLAPRTGAVADRGTFKASQLLVASHITTAPSNPPVTAEVLAQVSEPGKAGRT